MGGVFRWILIFIDRLKWSWPKIKKFLKNKNGEEKSLSFVEVRKVRVRRDQKGTTEIAIKVRSKVKSVHEKIFILKKASSTSKKLQNYTLTNHGVKCPILKFIKIRDLGMENDFFVLRLKICPCGVDSEILMGFCVFKNSDFL